MEGYNTMFDDKIVTVWSAPNYVMRCGNDACILEIDENLDTNFKKFLPGPKNNTVNTLPDYFL